MEEVKLCESMALGSELTQVISHLGLESVRLAFRNAQLEAENAVLRQRLGIAQGVEIILSECDDADRVVPDVKCDEMSSSLGG